MLFAFPTRHPSGLLGLSVSCLLPEALYYIITGCIPMGLVVTVIRKHVTRELPEMIATWIYFLSFQTVTITEVVVHAICSMITSHLAPSPTPFPFSPTPSSPLSPCLPMPRNNQTSTGVGAPCNPPPVHGLLHIPMASKTFHSDVTPSHTIKLDIEHLHAVLRINNCSIIINTHSSTLGTLWTDSTRE